MVAVIMGMSAFAPTAMAKGNPNGVDICHRGGVVTADPTDDLWEVMTMKEQAVPAHIDHGDFVINESVTDHHLADCDGTWHTT
jgi:hypothetical protein